MLIRVGSGLLGAAAYITVVFAGNGLAFALGVALFSVWGASELYQTVRRQGTGSPTDALGFAACILFQFAAWTHGGSRFAPYLPALLMLLVIATLLSELVKQSELSQELTKQQPLLLKYQGRPIINVGTTLLGGIYVGWLFSYMTLLRGGMGAPVLVPPIAGTHQGQWLVIFVSASTWLSDVGALFIGTGLGRHKLAPSISPAKTWEGSIGGLLCSLAGGALMGLWMRLPLEHAVGLAFLCGLAGQVGDLCELALKRDLGVRDFGTVLPGHGGVLDRIDSLLFAAPLAYYYLLFFFPIGR